MNSRAFAFGAHCSNSLHGILSDDKYVTSYFCIFLLVFFLRDVVDAFACASFCVPGLVVPEAVVLRFFAVGAGAGTAERLLLLLAAVVDA